MATGQICYIYICIYIEREREKKREGERDGGNRHFLYYMGDCIDASCEPTQDARQLKFEKPLSNDERGLFQKQLLWITNKYI